eukprot:3639185-Prymnesium_polylepis.1
MGAPCSSSNRTMPGRSHSSAICSACRTAAQSTTLRSATGGAGGAGGRAFGAHLAQQALSVGHPERERAQLLLEHVGAVPAHGELELLRERRLAHDRVEDRVAHVLLASNEEESDQRPLVVLLARNF